VQQVAVGQAHACVLLETGLVHCWGDGGSGRLGQGNELSIGDDEPVAGAPAVQLAGPATSVSAGELASCATLSDGRLLCWGACAGVTGVDTACLGRPGLPENQEPIGDDELPSRVRPIELAGGRSANAIAVGAYHACTLAYLPIAGSHQVTCWGDWVDGAIGIPPLLDPTPAGQLEASITFAGGDVVDIAVGRVHSCAALLVGQDRSGEYVDDPHAECWGRGAAGATGYGTTEDVGEVQDVWYYGQVDLPPVQDVEVGDEFSCALTVDEDVYCWGAAAGPSGTDGAHGHPGLQNIGDDESAGSVGPVTVW
jgi:hypothetical protein